MSTADLDFTGERYIPGVPGAIAYEHGHRYAFARRYARGRRVLDAACGEGYGTAQLATVAASVCGVDIDPVAIAHARVHYGTSPNARFETAGVTGLPLADGTVDVVVSFETIEHLPAEDQPRMIAEFARVLSDDGVLVISSPNRRRYSDERGYHNPFHLHELYRDELAELLAPAFPAQRWWHQRPLAASALWSEVPAEDVEAWVGDGSTVGPAAVPEGLYFVVVASRRAGTTLEGPALSLFHDAKESELARSEAAHAEVMRLDNLLGDREAVISRKHEHVLHLEGLVAAREEVILQREAELDARDATIARLTAEFGTRTAALAQATNEARSAQQDAVAALEAQERIIEYRQSLRWWLQLPWVRARSWWRS